MTLEEILSRNEFIFDGIRKQSVPAVKYNTFHKVDTLTEFVRLKNAFPYSSPYPERLEAYFHGPEFVSLCWAYRKDPPPVNIVHLASNDFITVIPRDDNQKRDLLAYFDKYYAWGPKMNPQRYKVQHVHDILNSEEFAKQSERQQAKAIADHIAKHFPDETTLTDAGNVRRLLQEIKKI